MAPDAPGGLAQARGLLLGEISWRARWCSCCVGGRSALLPASLCTFLFSMLGAHEVYWSKIHATGAQA